MFNSFTTGCTSIVDFSMLIWVFSLNYIFSVKIILIKSQGSVVVFGAWATWTDNYAEYEKDQRNKNYCMNQPMMTAFVILILKWVNI